MQPLDEVEAALLYTVNMNGSAYYPINKIKGRWQIGPWRDWKGFPVCFKTKREAVTCFESWVTLALERWAEMKKTNPSAILTAVGIRG